MASTMASTLSWSGDGVGHAPPTQFFHNGVGQAPPSAPVNPQAIQAQLQQRIAEWQGDLGTCELQPYSSDVFDRVHAMAQAAEPRQLVVVCDRMERDVGLFAMEHPGVFVAAVAVVVADGEVELDARFFEVLTEAQEFAGPSVLVALLQPKPFLYRFNPELEQSFLPESGQMSTVVEDFLKREEQLVLFLAKQTGAAAADQLVQGLEAAGEAVTVLFGSDTGHAQECAAKISRVLKKGKQVKTQTMNEAGPLSGCVLFVTSTAGKGDFPANAVDFWQQLEKRTEPLEGLQFATLALGDSKYWPEPEHFAAAGRKLHARLAELGAKPLMDLEIGDEQEPDGYRAGYARWEQKVCKTFGISPGDSGQPAGDAPHMSPEEAKYKSNYLRGTLATTLRDRTTGAIPQPDQVVIKHHGIYLQDDRDMRPERQALGIEQAYSFMIRVRLTAGDSTAAQWAQMDDLAGELARPNLKITTRQTFQVQGIQKHNLIESVRRIQRAALDTIAACGDVARNVCCTSHPGVPRAVMDQVVAASREIHDHVLPRSSAWHEIFLMDGPIGSKKYKVGGSTPFEEEPLYGKVYLPRKWKMGVAIPPYNDVDVYSQDVGFIAIVEGGVLKGFNVVAGGGLGFTHNQRATFPRLGSMCGFVPTHEAKRVAEMMIAVQRDYGCRSDRKHARLKYTIHDRGIEWFKEQVEDLLGLQFQPPRPFEFTVRGDELGWGEQDGKLYCGLYIANGRVQGEEKVGLRKIADLDACRFRMTCNQSLCLTDIRPEKKAEIEQLLRQHGIKHGGVSGLRAESNACAALPLCGLAMAEAERYLPELVTLLETELSKHGLYEAPISIRMTGCPNSCGRPELAEIGLVGRAPGAYNLYLGGDHLGRRANRIYKEGLEEEQVVEALAPLFAQYAAERQAGERFGDFCVRTGAVKENKYGPDFHDF